MVIFVNLPGVIHTKVSLFIEYAKQRSLRVASECSALHVFFDAKEDFSVMDMKQTDFNLYTGHSNGPTLQVRDEQMFLANKKSAKKFIEFIHKVEGYYEHILIIGEMVRIEKSHGVEYHISQISKLERLASLIQTISTLHAASNVFQRIQICHSGGLRLKSSQQFFTDAVCPRNGSFQVSAPLGWSIVSKNGLAIDFLANNQEFFHLVSFLYKCVSNGWSVERIHREYALTDYSLNFKPNLQSLALRCHYPSKKAVPEAFYSPAPFFSASTGAYSRSATPVLSSPSSLV